MAGIASLIGSAIGSIWGGKKASDAMKKVKANLQEQRQRNDDWYNQRYNEDATQRADAQAMIARTEEAIKARSKAAAGTQAVMGGTEESVAATKAANAQAMADATSQIAVAGDRRKESIENQYQAKDEALQSEQNDMERARAREVTKAGSAVGELGGKIDELL
ncbi:MAG: hypothetical protein K2H46_07040 [Muribaculaceae bacterium]|nr:hypothetical protein [Muribaculaceae bacterium]